MGNYKIADSVEYESFTAHRNAIKAQREAASVKMADFSNVNVFSSTPTIINFDCFCRTNGANSPWVQGVLHITTSSAWFVPDGEKSKFIVSDYDVFAPFFFFGDENSGSFTGGGGYIESRLPFTKD